MTVRGLGVLAFALALLAIVLAGGGCQAIISGDVPAFTCTGTAPGTCPAGQYCKGAGCVPCLEKGKDPCDGYDNDCNGIVDDSEDADVDRDGWPYCGKLNATGTFVDFDCDDTDPQVHPGAEERCDGRDDNCDGRDDNQEAVCGVGKLCTRAGKCIDEGSACKVSPSSCQPPKICDPDTLTCVDPNVEIGFTCVSDASCKKPYVCGDEAMLTSAITSKAAGSVCTKPCCTSADCPADFVCWGGGTGGSYCVAKALASRTTLGGNGPGAACARDADCRSGSCSPTTRTCVDTCCSAADCQNGAQCTLGKVGEHTIFACQPTAATASNYGSCSGDSQCKSGVCYEFGSPFFSYRRCIPNCCGAGSCGSIDGAELACANERLTSGDVVATCSYPPSSGRGTRKLGDPCTNNAECFSFRCAGTKLGQRCIDVCCTDRDCGAPGWGCRAVSVNFSTGGTAKVLRCQPL